jgi:hypothetical protein
MSSVNVKVPDSILRKAEDLAQRDGVALDQFIASAVCEKVTALLTVEHLKERAAKGSLEIFREILKKVPDVEPEEYDRL